MGYLSLPTGSLSTHKTGLALLFSPTRGQGCKDSWDTPRQKGVTPKLSCNSRFCTLEWGSSWPSSWIWSFREIGWTFVMLWITFLSLLDLRIPLFYSIVGFFFFFEMGFCHVAQAGLELLLKQLSLSVSQVARTTGTYHRPICKWHFLVKEA
jgi:hypothetical protein